MTNKDQAYQECSRCLMDTSDSWTTFDSEGVCSHCHDFDNTHSKFYMPNDKGEKILNDFVAKIKEENKNNEYDCIIGLSGGADSSYMAIKVKELGLRPLVVHVDAGWNSELAVSNIEKIVKHCDFDLHTCVINWEEIRDLQLSYLKSGISNQDVPQDHAFFASLYKYATKHNIKYILSGGNISTECVFPKTWHGSAMDEINLRAVHKRFGEKKLKTYPTVSFFQYYVYFPFIYGMRTFRPLNFMPYNKKEAMDFLEKEIGWKPYARKHGESVFTKLFQNYWLPTKYGYDKRRMHLSSLIMTGQLSRAQAKAELDLPLYDEVELKNDIEYFCKKLRISEADFYKYLNEPNRDYSDFSNWDQRYQLAKKAQNFVERLRGRKIKVYS